MNTSAVIKTSSKNENVFITAVWFLWLVIAGFTIFHHEMWRDELQAWSLVKASPNFTSLIQNISYEGHPLLWFFLLWILKFFSTSTEAIQFLHFGIAAATAFVFLRFAPFSKLHRALFIFGYFPLYEYAVISRNYALGILLLFIFCAVFQRKKGNYILLSFLLFMIIQTNFFAAILAAAIGFGLALDVFISRKTHIYNKSKMLSATIIFLVGLILSAFSIFPPADHFFGGSWRSDFSISNLGGVFTSIWRSFVPVPNLNIHFWNTNIIENLWLQLVFSIFILFFCLLILNKNRIATIVFIAGIATILLFFYCRMFGSLRHSGHLYLLFIACLWISNYHNDNKKIFPNLNFAYMQGLKNAFVTCILLFQVFAAFRACYVDYKFPFSAAKTTAKYIENNADLKDLPICADADMIVSTVSGYLQKPVYYPITNKKGTFIIWNKERNKNLSEKELIIETSSFSAKEKSDILLVLSYPLKEKYTNIAFIKSFTESIEPTENYYLYRYKFKD